MSTSPDAGSGRRVLRNRSTLRIVAVLVVPLVALGLREGKTPGLWFGGAAFLLLAAAWPRVIVDRGGLTVVNVLPHRVAREDIAAVQWRHRWDRAGLFLVLADWRKLWAWGVLTDGYGTEPGGRRPPTGTSRRAGRPHRTATPEARPRPLGRGLRASGFAGRSPAPFA